MAAAMVETRTDLPSGEDIAQFFAIRAKWAAKMSAITWFVRTISASLLGALTAFGLNGAVVAASTCLEGPNLNAGQGRHWYYRVDRINHHKCWYAAETGLKAHEDAPPNSTLFSWFTSLGAGAPETAGMQSSTTPESRVPPAVPGKRLKVVNAVAKVQFASPQRLEGAVKAERNQRSASRSSAEHAEQVNPRLLDQAAQDALFLEFLRWKELQKK
jgi:hypothetical protein